MTIAPSLTAGHMQTAQEAAAGCAALLPAPLSTPIFPQKPAAVFPRVDVATIAAADALAVDDYGIDLLQMMELAGAALADVVFGLMPGAPVSVLVGSGNNGAGGLCAARHLANRGQEVTVVALALPKAIGDRPPRLFVADLGWPRALWQALGVEVGHLFREGRVVEAVG